MSAEGQKTFSREMAELRRQKRPLEPKEIAQMAIKAGLNAHEALLEIQDHFEYRQPGDSAEALALFISSICEQSKVRRVLEYASIASLMTVRLVEKGKKRQLTFISPDQSDVETLQVLFEKKSPFVVSKISDIPNETKFDVIVCQPPLGYRSKSDSAADGFGGPDKGGFTRSQLNVTGTNTVPFRNFTN